MCIGLIVLTVFTLMLYFVHAWNEPLISWLKWTLVISVISVITVIQYMSESEYKVSQFHHSLFYKHRTRANVVSVQVLSQIWWVSILRIWDSDSESQFDPMLIWNSTKGVINIWNLFPLNHSFECILGKIYLLKMWHQCSMTSGLGIDE